MMKTGEFKMYDYGSAEKNFEKYGQEIPPFYDTEDMADNIRQIPTLLIRGNSDSLVDEKDYEELVEILEDVDTSNGIKPFKGILIKDYGHNDYSWAADAKEKVGKPLLNFLASLK